MNGHDSCCPAFSRRSLLVGSVVIGAAAALGFDLSPPTVEAVSGAGAYSPVSPVRVADTRSGVQRSSPNQFSVQIAGVSGVPASATAAAVIVSCFPSGAPGFVSVRPGSGLGPVPTTSNVNHTASGAVSNLALVGLENGSINVYHHAAGTAVAVDVVGFFVPAVTSRSGRFVVAPVPTRLFDTRQSSPFADGEVRPVAVGSSVPADAVAVAVNITSVGQSGTEWRVWPGGQVPEAVNVRVARPTYAGFAVVPVVNGMFLASPSIGGHLVVDLVGWFTGPSAAESSEGLFVPASPVRLLDTRTTRQQIPAGMSRETDIRVGQVGAFVANVTAVSPSADGFATLWAAGEARPSTSSLNWSAGSSPMMNCAFVQAGSRGVAVAVHSPAHMIVDVSGWFTGSRSTGTVPPSGWQPYGIAGVNMEAHADEWFDYGISTQGRPLRAFRYGSGQRKALLVTGIHGNEHSGTSILADLVTRGQIDGWTLFVVPVANPDARASNVRYVKVDMNRDFPVGWAKATSPHLSGCVTTQTGQTSLSLAESRAIRQAVLSGPFTGVELSISHHDNYNWVAPQSGSPSILRTLCTDYAKAARLRTPGQSPSTPKSISYTNVPGGFETWMKSVGAKSILVENKAGWTGINGCTSPFGRQPTSDAVTVHYQALKAMLLDARLPR